ncbi:DUF6270 domain-containing protein [Phenylobacterium sp.]|uniref:DUF6270 domain-containing protein n=1 Tax=Phenylobacterium sp. TaxID=1871053 RepID=UPI003982FB17
MNRVAVLGSCITRDLWPIRGEEVDGLLYLSRTSLPSLFSDPVSGVRSGGNPPGELRRHQHRALLADLNKTALARLVAFRPTHLIFDFIDERFDLLSVGPSLVTQSWELEASGYLRQRVFKGARRIPRLSPACDRLWLQAAGEFAALVRATPLRDARLILHVARWADRRVGRQGRPAPLTDVEILPGRPADVGQQNDLLARYEAAFTELMPPMERVDAPGQRLADDAHQWGLSPFHYVPQYYAEIWRQLEALGVSARPGAPSAPAA